VLLRRHNYMCPVCGYGSLSEPPRSPNGGALHGICPSCGFEFGWTDDDQGYCYADWRARWRDEGCAWHSTVIRRPRGWDASTQLAALQPNGVPKVVASLVGRRKGCLWCHTSYVCPVCGFDDFAIWRWERVDEASYEYCPSCGFHIDPSAGPGQRAPSWLVEKLQQGWVDGGMRWSAELWVPEFVRPPCPPDWDPSAQLKKLLDGDGASS